MPQYRADQHLVHLSVTGVPLDNIQWDTFSGGDLQAADVSYPPGGMLPVVNLGGTPTRSDITLTRAWSDALISVFKKLDASTGRGAATIPVQTLDANGSPTGATITYSGVVKSVARPDYDHKGNDTAMLTVVIGANASIT